LTDFKNPSNLIFLLSVFVKAKFWVNFQISRTFETSKRALMGNIAAQKDYLINLISSIEDEAALTRVKEVLEKIRQQDELVAMLTKPMPETLDVEAIKRRQNWKGVDRAKWDSLIEEMDIQEPVETLLAQLTK
jgi:hypothetical protein